MNGITFEVGRTGVRMAITSAEKMRRRRAKLKLGGKCTVCGVRKAYKPQKGAKAPYSTKPLSVCIQCNEEAKGRVKESRATSE